MNPPSKSEWVIGLHHHPQSPPASDSFSRFYTAVTRVLAELGTAITHLGADGNGHNGKLVTANSKAAKKIVKSGFEGITVLACVVSPEGSNEPAYDRVVSASLGWNAPDELLLCVVVNEGVTSFLSKHFEMALSEFIVIESWSYGYAFRDTVERQPDFHVLSIDNGRLGDAEREALGKWYATGSPERVRRLRSVYPITIANEMQLALSVDGHSLGQFMQRTSGTTFERSGDLFLWRVPESQLDELRSSLGAAGALIA